MQKKSDKIKNVPAYRPYFFQQWKRKHIILFRPNAGIRMINSSMLLSRNFCYLP